MTATGRYERRIDYYEGNAAERPTYVKVSAQDSRAMTLGEFPMCRRLIGDLNAGFPDPQYNLQVALYRKDPGEWPPVNSYSAQSAGINLNPVEALALYNALGHFLVKYYPDVIEGSDDDE